MNTTGAGFNIGDYNDPTGEQADATQSMHGADRQGGQERGAVLREEPAGVLYLPDQDYLLAVNSKKVGGTADGWMSMTQQQRIRRSTGTSTK